MVNRLIIVLLCLFIAGCGALDIYKQDNPADPSTVGSILVSNLADTNSQNELKAVLQKAGVTDARQQVFWAHVQQFNDCVGKDKLINGWQSISYTESTFDEYELQDLWSAKYPVFSGYNCRLTAFGLMANQISVENTADPDTRNIYLDIDSVAADGSVFVNDSEQAKFEALFSTISSTESKDQNNKISEVKSELAGRGVVFLENSPIHLVSVYMHANYGEGDSEIFVGHTGVMFDLGDEGIYFLEKLAFQAPYRFIKLDSRQQLYDYLLEHYKEYQGPDDAPAFIMDNGESVAG